MTTRTTYPSYKPSGIDWLGDIPSHWDVVRTRSLIENSVAGIWGEEPNGHGSDVWCIRVADFDVQELSVSKRNQTYRLIEDRALSSRWLREGDILLEKSGGGDNQPVGRVVLYDDPEPAVTSNFVTRLRPSQNVVEPRYLLRLLDLIQVRRIVVPAIRQTTGIQNLNEREYLSYGVSLPPLDEQRAIAEYLDRKDAEITRFIESRRRMIALLEEKKQAIINQAVTRGLDPSVPMKDSGVEWLGEIPAHWELTKLGRLVHTRSGGTPSMGNSEYWNGDIPWVSSKDMKSTRIFDTHDHISLEAKLSGATGLAPEGTLLVVVRSGILRHSIPTAIAEREITFNQDIKGLTADPEIVDMRWLQLLIAANQSEFLEQWRKQVATVESIELPWMLNTTIPLPPLDAQRDLVTWLDALESKTSQQIGRFERETELIQEYRTRLISDVVTGKVKVA